MIHFFLYIYDKLNTKKWLTACLLVICLIGSFILISRLHYQEDISDFLPKDKKNEAITEIYQHIGGQNKILVIFNSDKGTQENAGKLVSVMDEFIQNWQKTDTANIIKDMKARVDEETATDVLNFVQSNYPYFLTSEDYQRMDSLLKTPEFIDKQLEYDKQMLMLPAGSTLSNNIQYDPLHLFTPILKRLQSFQISDKYGLYDGCIFTDNWHKGLINFTSPFGMSESEQNGKIADMLERAINLTKQNHPDIRISAIGAPLIAVTNATQIKKDGILAVSLSVIFIFALLMFAFRRFSDLLWIIISISSGWLFALGGMAIYTDNTSIIVLGIGSVIIGIAVNYPLHFLDHLRHEADKRQALKEMIPPLLIGNITTVGAFLSLAWMNAAAMRDLGVFGSLVMIGTILFVLVFLPVFAKSRKHFGNAEKLTFGKLASFSLESKKYLFWPIAVLTIVLGVFSLNTSFDSNLQHINYMTEQQRNDLNLLSDNFQKDGNKCVYAIAEGKDMQTALQKNESMMSHINRLKGKGDISSVSGISNFIPSKQKQSEAIIRWNAFRSKYRQQITLQLQEAAVKQGFSQTAFAPFAELLEKDFQTQPVSYFAPIENNIGSNYIFRTKNKIHIISFVQVPDKHLLQVKKQLNTSCLAFDQGDVGSKYVDELSFDFNYVGYACGFIVFFFLWLSFGRLELSLISFLPLAVSWVWILGIMQIFDIRFNIVNIVK